MPYRDMDDEAQRKLAGWEALSRLADVGRQRSERGDRPMEPPPRPKRKALSPFPVSEDAANPVNERPGMTNILQIQIETTPFSTDDVVLVRYAVWSMHPLFDTRYRVDSSWHETSASIRYPTMTVRDLIIEVPASKIARPSEWIQRIIEDVLPTLHDFIPIKFVQFGREPGSFPR